MLTLKDVVMNMERTASVFRNGRSQALRIPKGFELACKQVTIRKEGEALVIEPAKFSRSLAEIYGNVRAKLEFLGTPMGANDLWIAAHALSLNLTLVTDNEEVFGRVENWLRD